MNELENVAEKRFEKVREYIIYSSFAYAILALILSGIRISFSGLESSASGWKIFLTTCSYYAPMVVIVSIFLTKKEKYSVAYIVNGEKIARARDCITCIIFTLIGVVPIVVLMFFDQGIREAIMMCGQTVQTFLVPYFSFYFGVEKNKS